jgi:hypothetical protein
MTIPECRAWLLSIANSLAIKGNCDDETRGIRAIANELWRRPAVRKTRVKAQPSTPSLRQQIRDYAEAHPDMNNREIGRVFKVDGGRVSEALAGFRK